MQSSAADIKYSPPPPTFVFFVLLLRGNHPLTEGRLRVKGSVSSHTARAQDRRTPWLPHTARLHPWVWERDINADGHQTRVRHAIPRHRHISKVHITRLLWKSWRAARTSTRALVPRREQPGGQAWPGLHVAAACGAQLGFPALPSALSPVGPATNSLGAGALASKESQLSPDPSPCPRGGGCQARAVYTGLSTRPCSPRDTSLAPPPLMVPRRGFFCPQLVEVTSCLWPQGLRGSHRPRGGRRSLEADGLRQTSFPADNLQIFTEGLLCSCSVPPSAGQTEMPCNRQGACVPAGEARLTLGNQGSC